MSSVARASVRIEGFATEIEIAGAGDRRLARRICQALFFLPLFSLMLLPEYVQGLGDPETKSALYRVTSGPLRMVDILLLGLIAGHCVAWASSRRFSVSVPKKCVLPGMGFAVSVAVSMAYGWLHGGNNLFFDWRALALGAGLYPVFAMWVQSDEDASWAAQLFAGYMALRVGLLFVDFARGGGDVVVGTRIPVFDGPTLSAIVFAAVLALCLSDASGSRRRALLWGGVSVAGYVMVLLCFRRTFWTELGVATLLLLLTQKTRRGWKLVLAAVAIVSVAATLGPSFYERLQSMDFTQDETEFSQGNPDHVGEVLDAWEQVQQHPVMGIGLGQSFQTSRIQGWKEKSVMVHNAPLHVWLKYGLLGLVCYVWFHAAVFYTLWVRVKADRSLAKSRFICRLAGTVQAVSFQQSTRAFVCAALCFLAAQFVVSFGFMPWPYSSLQSTTLIAFVLAVAMRGTGTCNYQPYPSLLPR